VFKHAEKVFIEYFLSKIAPSTKSEVRRVEVFSKVRLLIEKALGNVAKL